MDRARRAEPYSSATIWTREIARNLAGHLSRVSKAHSCVDTRSPKSTRLPQFHHTYVQKRCPTSPIKTRQSVVAAARHSEGGSRLEFHGFGESSAREEAENTPRLVRKPLGTYSQRADGRRKSLPRKIKSISMQTHANSVDGSTVLTVNQDTSEQFVKTPDIEAPVKQALRGSTRDGATYASPSMLPHHRHRAVHDYNKRQEQRKIWKENQALSKRLQSTKATLNSKEWEKDDKWTQEFLKNQERRRSALHQEMRKAQASPQAVLRVKPLKMHHTPHLKDAPHQTSSEKNLRSACSPLKIEIQGAMTARELPRRRFKEYELPKDRSKSSASSQHPTASNHRRIMELRKKKPAPTGHESKTACPGGVLGSASNRAPVYAEGNTEKVLDGATTLQNDEVVNVRFTFSRGRSRGTSGKADAVGDLERVESLEMNHEQERDVMSLSGAFSPGLELESALNAAAMDGDVPITNHATTNRTGSSSNAAESAVTTQTIIKPRASRDRNEDVADAVSVALQGCIDSVLNESELILETDDAVQEVAEHKGVSPASPTEISVASTLINDRPTSADAEDDEVRRSPDDSLCDPTVVVADEISSKLEEVITATDFEPTQLQVEVPSFVSDERTPSSPRAADLPNVAVESDGKLETAIDENIEAPKHLTLPGGGEGPEGIGDIDVGQQAGAIIAAPIEDTAPQDEIAPMDDVKDREERYEEDNFEEEPVSARVNEGGDTVATGSSVKIDAKEETSGYGSEFEEDEDSEPPEETAGQGSAAVLAAPESGDDKYEEGEASYSHDDFVD